MSGGRKIRKIVAIPHFHYDVEWWKTEEGYNRDVAGVLDKALDMLGKYPSFKYVIDQALALRPYWESRPEMREEIRKYVAEGRIELVGGTFCAPDENIPTGEAFARQFVYGRRFFEGEVGGKVVCAWEIDEFGHPSQAPQIAARAGMTSFTFARGVQAWSDPDEPLQFMWEAPDGTRLLTHWFAGSYTSLIPIGNRRIEGLLYPGELRKRVAYEAKRARADVLMVPFGSDFTEPSEAWVDVVEGWGDAMGARLEFGLPRDYFDEIRGADLPVVKGELNPLLDGSWESREKVKRMCRATQHGIMDAEKLASVAHALGAEYPSAALDEAWERILENDFHDIVCGTGIDPVYQATMRRYEEACERIEGVRSAALDAIGAKVDASGSGAKVLISNTLSHARADVARVPLAELPKGESFRAVGPDGKQRPCRMCGDELLIIADAPAFGYSVYTVSPAKKAAARCALKVDGLSAENEYFRITMDEATGGLKSIVDVETGLELLDTSRFAGNEIVVEEEVGNLWTIHKTGREWRASEHAVEIEAVDESPVRAGFKASGAHEGMRRVQRVHLYAGIKRIEFETEIDFHGRDRRVKVMFAPALDGAPRGFFETPFYTDERGPGHWCAQNWADVSDGARGLAVLNSGNPGHDFGGGALGLALMRSVSAAPEGLLRFVKNNFDELKTSLRTAARYAFKERMPVMAEWALYGFHGLMLREYASGGGPESRKGINVFDHIAPMLTPERESDAWERGEHRFRYAVLPHEGGWADARLPHEGLAFNTPLSARVLSAGGAKGKAQLPKSYTFMDLGAGGNAILTALKKSEDGAGFAARIYDAYGVDGEAAVSFFKGMKRCRKTNIAEDGEVKPLRVRDGRAKVPLGHWEIGTLRFDLNK